MSEILDNIVWHTLCGPHAGYAAGSGAVRRYMPGFSPFIGFTDPAHPDFSALAACVEAGEQVYCDGWDGAAPDGWLIQSEATLVKMTWEGLMPAVEEEAGVVLLGVAHAAAAFELASLTRPGPFSLRSLELGTYLGWFDGERLMAMAGARRCAGGFSEITSVCTHPGVQGRGWARRLVMLLIRRQMQDGASLFLRVMRDNSAIHGFYRDMGFRDYRDSTARMIARR